MRKLTKGDSAPVSQGSSSIKPPKESIDAVGDQVEHDGEELAEKSKDAEAEKTAEDKHKDKIKEINVKEDVDALINGSKTIYLMNLKQKLLLSSKLLSNLKLVQRSKD